MILVHSYGKVASTSLQAALSAAFPDQVNYSHGLRPKTLAVAEAYQSATGHIGNWGFLQEVPAVLARFQAAHKAGQTVDVITGVRDPVTRSLAAAMQMVDYLFSECISPDAEATACRLVPRLRDLWVNDTDNDDPVRRMAEWIIRAPLFWLNREIEEAFGFDLLRHAFDPHVGYRLLEHEGIRLLLYRIEDAPYGIERGLAHLYPDRNIKLPVLNEGRRKETGEVYERLKAVFRLPYDRLAEIYENPYVAHFYRREAQSSIARWAESDAVDRTPPRCLADAGRVETHRATAPAAAGGPEVVATVVVPLFNRGNFIEERLESLFAHWTPGLELIVVDDASTDDGFAVTERTLSRHPHIAATTIRNPTPRGMGMLEIILKLARGDVIIQADSDDIALPGRLQAIQDCFASDPTCRLVTSNALLLSADGFVFGLHHADHPDEVFTDPIAAAGKDGDARWLGATMAFHRSLFTLLPPIDPALCPYGLDLLLPFRALLLGSHHYVCRPLVGWRQHARNSHRIAGAYNNAPSEMERHLAFSLMVSAQKLRDAEFSGPGEKSERLAEICRAHLQSKQDEWIRLRAGLGVGPSRELPDSSPKGYSPQPPVTTLQPGRRIEIASPFGAAMLDGWPGFHEVERWGVWTRRCALVCFRMPSRQMRLRISLVGLSFAGQQRVKLSFGLEHWLDFVLTGGEKRMVEIDANQAGIVPLVICSLDAAKPPSQDRRILGVGLLWIEAYGAALEAAATP